MITDLLSKIKFKIKEMVADGLLKLSLYINSPSLTTLALRIGSSTINNRGQYTILCLGITIFMDDINALVEFSGRLKYKVIHFRYLETIFSKFIFGPHRDSLTDESYHTETSFNPGKKNYYLYLKKVFPILKKMMGFDAILSGNIGYTLQQELARVCQENSVPFIILHKEALVVLQAYDNFLEHYRTCKLIADKILFYNKHCLEGFLGLKIDGLTRDKVELVGIPRFDNYFLKKGSPSVERKT